MDSGNGESRPTKEWIVKIKEKLDQVEKEDTASSWAKICIYKIPRWLREGGGNEAYTPQIVSLGPYHHGKRCLRNMEQHKWRALHHILKRSNQHIELYIEAIKVLEEKARACYEGPIYLTSDKFVEMMILDACFVLEHFRGFECNGDFTQLGYSENDPIFSMGMPIHSILVRDMILLENQIPLFIMDKLYGIQCGNPDQRGKVADLALSFFHNLMLLDARLEYYLDTCNLDMTEDEHHCLAVFWRSLLQDEPRPASHMLIKRWTRTRTWMCTWVKRWLHTWIKVWPAGNRSGRNDKVGSRVHDFIHCATKLTATGIRFEQQETNTFWEITFENGILKIPPLLIHDGTMPLFLNLIAYEQCHRDCTKDITSYVTIMSSLIESPADVSYLHQRGIIKKWLWSDAMVAEMFIQLRRKVFWDIDDSLFPEYRPELLKQVNRYYENKWNGWWASLTEKYFSNPWSTISFFAAILLLGLTMLQTFYTVYSPYRLN